MHDAITKADNRDRKNVSDFSVVEVGGKGLMTKGDRGTYGYFNCSVS